MFLTQVYWFFFLVRVFEKSYITISFHSIFLTIHRYEPNATKVLHKHTGTEKGSITGTTSQLTPRNPQRNQTSKRTGRTRARRDQLSSQGNEGTGTATIQSNPDLYRKEFIVAAPDAALSASEWCSSSVAVARIHCQEEEIKKSDRSII